MVNVSGLHWMGHINDIQIKCFLYAQVMNIDDMQIRNEQLLVWITAVNAALLAMI